MSPTTLVSSANWIMVLNEWELGMLRIVLKSALVFFIYIYFFICVNFLNFLLKTLQQLSVFS